MDAKTVDKIIKARGYTPEQAECYKYFWLDRGCFTKVISDEQYNQMVRNRLDKWNTEELALEKLGIDIDQVKEIAPVNLTGYDFFEVPVIKQESGDYVSPKVDLIWLFFSDTQIYIYTCKFSMFSSVVTESTEEYFYKDVTAFKTETKAATPEKDEHGQSITNVPPDLQYNLFSVIVPGATLHVAFNNLESSSDTIAGVKQKLREKKNA